MDTVRIGFGYRFLAGLVDGIVCAALTFIPVVVLGTVLGPIVAGIIGGLLGMSYYSLEVFRAQSVGKIIFRYRITAQDGSPATREQLVKRWAYKQVPQALMIVGVIPMLGFVGMLAGIAGLAILVGTLMALKPEKLAFHDKLFGTAVYGPAKLSVMIPSAAEVTRLPSRAPTIRPKAA